MTENVSKLMESLFPSINIEDPSVPFCRSQLQLFNEDHLKTMERMPPNFIDFAITSPPYGRLRQYHGYKFSFKKCAHSLFRVLKEGGVLVWVVGDETIDGSESGESFYQALYFKSLGFKLYDTMIYRKENPRPLNHRRYTQEFEYMFVLSKGQPRVFNPIMTDCSYAGHFNRPMVYDGDTLRPAWGYANPISETKIIGNVWSYPIGAAHSRQTNFKMKNHPAIFPEQLVRDHMISWTDENDLVYDPMSGSGTVGLIAKSLNRRFIGSEISPEYCELSVTRINEHN